jgi:hypothetical protein
LIENYKKQSCHGTIELRGSALTGPEEGPGWTPCLKIRNSIELGNRTPKLSTVLKMPNGVRHRGEARSLAASGRWELATIVPATARRTVCMVAAPLLAADPMSVQTLIE